MSAEGALSVALGDAPIFKMSQSDESDDDGNNCSFKLTISTEQLIQAIHNRSCLWNKYDVTYRDKKARDKAWTEVYKEVYSEFDTLKEKLKARVGQQISKKWFNIRDAYVKSSKQGRPYIYMNILGFLDPFIPGDKNIGNQESFLEEDQSESWFQTSFVDIEEKPKIKKRKTDVAAKDFLEINEPDSNNLVSILARLVDKEEDEDRAFFTSILPSVKSLTDNSKLEFKIQVMKLLKEFKTKDSDDGFVKVRETDSD